LGDRARYPLKLRPKGLVNASIVVAVLRKRRNTFDQHECVSPLFITLSTPSCERWTLSFRKGLNIGNFGRLYNYHTMAIGGWKAAKTAVLGAKQAFFNMDKCC
jgi:hypothetical protein